MLFGNPDKVPLSPGGGRESTLKAWHEQGLPGHVADTAEYAYRLAGGKQQWPSWGPGFSIHERMIPTFEEKVLERRERSQVVQDWKGNICEISNDYTVEYLRVARDFVTRKWIKCPVETRDDWLDMKRRYDPDDPSRLPENPHALKEALADRDWYLTFHFSGPFWQLREWLGFENLCMMFYDDPDFLREMLDFWSGYVASLLEKALQYVVPDEVHLSEDMAYKKFSMISPQMVREFLLPVYKRWGNIARNAGVPVYGIDSDGYIGELIPIWMEAGVNACDPIEVAAGNDIVAMRKEFGHKMAYRGGIDKRAMAKGGRILEEEVDRVTPVIRDGGYVPGCDHGIPADVSWQNFVHYVGLLAERTGWL